MTSSILAFLGLTAAPLAGLLFESPRLGTAEWTAIGAMLVCSAYLIAEFRRASTRPRSLRRASFRPVSRPHSHQEGI